MAFIKIDYDVAVQYVSNYATGTVSLLKFSIVIHNQYLPIWHTRV